MSHSRFFILASSFVLPALSAVVLACTATTDLGAHDPASEPDAALAANPLPEKDAAADPDAKPVDGSATPNDAESGVGLVACSNGVRGTANPVTTKTDLPSRVAGRWLFCPAGMTDAINKHAGIEISAAGQWWFLLPNGTREPGVDNAGTWDQAWATDNQPNLIYFHFSTSGVIFHFLAFEEGPRRMIATGMIATWHAVPAP